MRGEQCLALSKFCLSAPPEILEESHSGCVLPTSLRANSLKKSSWGFLFTGIIGGTLVAVYAVATPFLTPALRKICLPFVPATTKQIENVVKMLHCRRGSLVDIGSDTVLGERECTALPNFIFQICGRYVTFSQYSNVIIFGVPQMMLQLEEKLTLELKDDARVIACRFPFPRWTPDHVTGEGVDTVWTYDVSTVRGKGPRRPVCFQPSIQMGASSDPLPILAFRLPEMLSSTKRL
ncbi:hypothetical protein GH733_004680 [Mirounga leonina]|nr:hypothetical protein GH733_004680 [Mirounga leonina]